jgi:hypothetical protein
MCFKGESKQLTCLKLNKIRHILKTIFPKSWPGRLWEDPRRRWGGWHNPQDLTPRTHVRRS